MYLKCFFYIVFVFCSFCFKLYAQNNVVGCVNNVEKKGYSLCYCKIVVYRFNIGKRYCNG